MPANGLPETCLGQPVVWILAWRADFARFSLDLRRQELISVRCRRHQAAQTPPRPRAKMPGSPNAKMIARLSNVTILLVIIVSSVGCVRRRLTVRTDQPGATISVDNQVIGTSEAATRFTYYGTREIRAEKAGFRTETLRHKINPPWYQYPIVDFFAETLWPGEIRDERIVDIQMVPKQMADQDEVLQRADSLRMQSRNGIVTAPR